MPEAEDRILRLPWPRLDGRMADAPYPPAVHHAAPVLLRLLLAVQMALWSPLWCCCWLRGGLDLLVGPLIGAAEGGEADRCCARPTGADLTVGGTSLRCPHCRSMAVAAGAPSCCATDEDESRSLESPSLDASTSDGQRSEGPGEEGGGCRCHEQGRDVSRDSTGTSLVLAHVEALPIGLPLPIWSQPPPPVPGRRTMAFVAPSPPPTLVRLHILLLT